MELGGADADRLVFEPFSALSVEPLNGTGIVPWTRHKRTPFSALSVEPLNGTSASARVVKACSSFSALSVEPLNGTLDRRGRRVGRGVRFQCSLC